MRDRLGKAANQQPVVLVAADLLDQLLSLLGGIGRGGIVGEWIRGWVEHMFVHGLTTVERRAVVTRGKTSPWNRVDTQL